MMMMFRMRWCRSLPLTKLQEEETDPWPRSCRTTSRSRHHGASPGGCRARWNSTVLLRRTNSVGEKPRSLRRSSTPLVHLMVDYSITKRWVSLPAPSPPQATPLWIACHFESWESALLLLSRGADPNRPAIYSVTGSFSLSPLHCAAEAVTAAGTVHLNELLHWKSTPRLSSTSKYHGNKWRYS